MASGSGQKDRETWRFAATSTVEGEETILKLEGRIGHHGAALLKRAGEGILDRGVNRLALDLAGVDYMSSAGLRAIAELAEALKERSGTLRLVDPTDPVRLVLDLSGLSGRLATQQQ